MGTWAKTMKTMKRKPDLREAVLEAVVALHGA
jgi:hypothetical protein